MKFHIIWYLSVFQTSVYKIKVSVKSDKSNMKTIMYFWSFLTQLFLEW
jgi:hypothetical protein